jgi:hypothetical protein
MSRASIRLAHALLALGIGAAAAAVAQMPATGTLEPAGALRALRALGVGSDRGAGPVTPGPDTPYLQAFGRPALQSTSSSLTVGRLEVTP